MSCKDTTCQGKIMNSGRYKGKKICDFPDGMGGFANCDKKYIGLDSLNPGCSNNPNYLRSCCKLSTCITKSPTPTKSKNNNNNYTSIIIISVIFIFFMILIGLYYYIR